MVKGYVIAHEPMALRAGARRSGEIPRLGFVLAQAQADWANHKLRQGRSLQ